MTQHGGAPAQPSRVANVPQGATLLHALEKNIGIASSMPEHFPSAMQRQPGQRDIMAMQPLPGQGKAEVEAANALLALFPSAGSMRSETVAAVTKDPVDVFRPGTFVWAKVEGHDWWPALVIRRRAVPRHDIGPPPGGPANVMNCFPVVFLTSSGVPSEVTDTMDSHHGALAASLRAHKGTAGSDEFEAEYAWVMPHCLRIFEAGKHQSFVDQLKSNDELMVCILAAERAAAQLQDELELDYDSDGGWGHAQKQASETGNPATASRRSRASRSRGGRRGRNRRPGGGDDGDVGPLTFFGPQIVVDSILGWRHPLSSAERAAQQKEARETQATKLQQLQALARKYGIEKAAKAIQNMDLSRLEGADGADADANATDASEEREYLIKWNEHSHVRNEWVPEQRVMALAKRKLLNFTKKYGEKPTNLTNSNWVIPERFVARRKCPFGPGWEILVKWTELGYENCTWEGDVDQIILDPRHIELLTDFWRRQYAGLNRSRPAAQIAYEERLGTVAAQLPLMQPTAAPADEPCTQPAYITAAQLEPHQVAGAAMLRRMYILGKDCILADDPAMGMVATVLTYVQMVRREFQPPTPSLIIVPSGSMPYWKGEVEYWVQDDSEIIFYTGPPGARQQIASSEFWLQPGALDGKVPSLKERLESRAPMPHVVITSMESVLQDLDEMKAMPWDVVVLDERHASKSFAQKMYPVLVDLAPRARLSMRDMSGDVQTEHLVSWAMFLNPKIQDLQVLQSADASERGAAIERLHNEIRPYVRRARRSELDMQSLPRFELQIPVQLSMNQAESYRITLAKQFEQLGNHKAQRHSGQRASMLRSLCSDVCRVCDHPYTIEQFEPEAESQRSLADYIQGSGKLHALQLLLDVLRGMQKRVVVAAHASLAVLSDYLTLKYGERMVHRIDEDTKAADRARAVDDFTTATDPPSVLVLELSACSLGTDLSAADVVIIYDSDGHPSGDIQALGCARRIGDPRHLLVFRLYCSNTLEEVIVAGGSGAPALCKALRPTTHRLSAADARLLEESLRFGVQRLFAADLEASQGSDEKAEVGSQDVGPMATRQGPLSRKLDSEELSNSDNNAAEAGQDGGKDTATATPATVATAERTDAQGGAAADTNGDVAVVGQAAAAEKDVIGAKGMELGADSHNRVAENARDAPQTSPDENAHVAQDDEEEEGEDDDEERQGTSRAHALPIAQEPPALRRRQDRDLTRDELEAAVKALQSLIANAPSTRMDLSPDVLPEPFTGTFVHDWLDLSSDGAQHFKRERSHDGEDEDEHAEEEEHEDGSDKMSVSMLASSSAAFWQRMLRHRWEWLRQEEADAMDEEGADEDGEDPVSGSEDARGGVEELGRRQSTSNPNAAWAGVDDADARTGSIVRGAAGSSGRAARSRRPKRRYDDDGTLASAEAGGGAHGTGSDGAGDAGGVADAQAKKKPRTVTAQAWTQQQQQQQQHQQQLPSQMQALQQPPQAAQVQAAQQHMSQAGPVPPVVMAQPVMQSVSVASKDELINLRHNFETIAASLRDPTSLVAGIFKRAHERIQSMMTDAGLDLGQPQDLAVYNFAAQAAQILLIMRPSYELPSDFQDYTLVALVAVAAHLSGHSLGSDEGIARLAHTYKQAPIDLRSVFTHIMGQMNEYRRQIDLMQSLEVPVALKQTPAPAPPGGANPPSVNNSPTDARFGANAPVVTSDSFSAELNAILQASSAIAAQRSNITEESSDYHHRMQWIQMVSNHPLGATPEAAQLIETVKQWAEMARAIVHTDVAHKWRIDAVQQKYQQHMEKVRSCAQGAIDSVNQQYKQEKAALEQAHGTIFSQLQQLAAVSPLGQHLSAHLASKDVQNSPSPAALQNLAMNGLNSALQEGVN